MFPIYIVLVTIVVASTNDAKEKAQEVSQNNPQTVVEEKSLPSSSVSVGKEGFLRVPNSDIVSVLKTKELQEEFMKSAIANDTYGMAKIISEGGGFNVPTGTKALVVDSEFGIRKVRILTGEYAMKDGWVAKEFIQPQ